MKKLPVVLIAAACALIPAGFAAAGTTAGATAAPAGQPAVQRAVQPTETETMAATTVARYPFERPPAATGTLVDTSGRGVALRVRSADGGAITYVTRGAGKAVQFPARCAATAATCRRVILEGGDDVDLDPGAQPFRYGATVRATAAQVGTGANVMQKGVATTQSQWKMQIGRQGKPNCVLVGRGSTRIYLARANVRITDGGWHTVSCRRAAGTLAIYVDGTLRASVAVPTTVSVSNTMPLRLGGRNMTNRSDLYGGALDDVYAVLG